MVVFHGGSVNVVQVPSECVGKYDFPYGERRTVFGKFDFVFLNSDA